MYFHLNQFPFSFSIIYETSFDVVFLPEAASSISAIDPGGFFTDRPFLRAYNDFCSLATFLCFR
jgi:hypothetical protein